MRNCGRGKDVLNALGNTKNLGAPPLRVNVVKTTMHFFVASLKEKNTLQLPVLQKGNQMKQKV